MKSLLRFTLLASLVFLAGLVSAQAAELAGKWQAEFDSQIGQQKYVYEFKGSGERQGTKSEVELKEVKVNKDEVSFVELLKIQDQEIRIEYTGKFTNDNELKLTRKVGEFASYEITAKRMK
jgi:hypothetical protein